LFHDGSFTHARRHASQSARESLAVRLTSLDLTFLAGGVPDQGG
ncbi:MAG: hypothetical protein ACI92W_002459, partial [Paraglaciecola sp.]